MALAIDPKYSLDPDALAVLRHWDERPGSLVLEVGANDNHTANVLAANGYQMLGIDLRPHTFGVLAMVNYHRLEWDFVDAALWTSLFRPGQFDVVVSTSAIEHFGLGTYDQDRSNDPDYDCKAMDAIYEVLKPGDTCYLTVPYGRDFIVNKPHWRQYNALALQERIVRRFGGVLVKEFFASGPICGYPDGTVFGQEFADSYADQHPHCACFLKMRKIV